MDIVEDVAAKRINLLSLVRSSDQPVIIKGREVYRNDRPVYDNKWY